MKVYVFGNEDMAEDNIAFIVQERLSGEVKDVEFIKVKPNEDLPFVDEKHVVLLDAVDGIDKVELIEDVSLLSLPPATTVHDFDLGFQLKYLKKLGKLGKVTIIGLPMKGEIDYFLIHSILRKLVAHEMQGS